MGIKQKGVCNVCTREFDLCEYSYHVEITKGQNVLDHTPVLEGTDAERPISTIIRITPLKNIESTSMYSTDMNVVCGKNCLFRYIDKDLGGPQIVENGNELETLLKLEDIE